MRSRRNFLCGLACGCAAASAPWVASPVLAKYELPKAGVPADKALQLLKEGNESFIKGACVDSGPPARIRDLAGGQAPFAIIVACSDSRTAPGDVFNRGLGDLFIVRVAGNTVDATGLGSIEYGIAVLGASLVVVMGHTRCGAVEAAVKVVKEKAKFPGAIGTMVAPIVPAVKGLAGGDDLVDRAIYANVQRTVDRLRVAKPIVAKGVAEGTVKVVGGVYDLATGKVDFGRTV